MASATLAPVQPGLVDKLNGPHHRAALNLFLFIIIAHWAEHLAQAFQIWGLGWARPDSLGVLGLAAPWLVSSEALHYGFALVTLVGLWVFRHAFVGRAYVWWMAAFWIQAFHHMEHMVLLGQAVVGSNLQGGAAPVSLVQLVVPRVELHLLYNVAVFIPLIIGAILHMRPNQAEYEQMTCSCHPRRRTPSAAGASAG